MRADRVGRLTGWIVVSCACLLCRASWAEPLPINLDVQYQRLEALGITREYWSRNLDANYSKQLNPSLQMSTQLRFNLVTLQGRPDRSFNPYGSLRLQHTYAGISGSYRPTEITNAAGFTTNQHEAQIVGFVAPKLLPRIDVEWTRSHRLAASQVPENTGTTRSGRLTWARGILDVRGGVGDIVLQSGDATKNRTSQQNWDAGAGIRTGRGRWNLMANYDLGEVRNNALSGSTDMTQSQTASALFTQRLAPRADWSLSYQYRVVAQPSGLSQQHIVTHDGAASWNYRPSRGTQVQASFGVRPVTSSTGNTTTLGYTLISGTANGRVRSGWTGITSATQSLNRQPDSRAYWVGTYRGASQLTLARGLLLDVDATVIANGDTAVTNQRMASQGLVGVSAIPLRRLTIAFSLRGYRAGPDLGTPVARSTSRNLDLRWQPMNGVDLGGNVAHSSALPKGDPTLTTKQLFAHLAPGSRLQLDLNYSISNQFRRDAGISNLPGREVWSGRLLAGLGRRFRVSAGGAVADPGMPTHSKQFDVTLSARLGVGT
jgi:hypothetical protein